MTYSMQLAPETGGYGDEMLLGYVLERRFDHVGGQLGQGPDGGAGAAGMKEVGEIVHRDVESLVEG